MNEQAYNEIINQKYVFDINNKTIDKRITGLVENLNIKGLKILDSSTLDGFHTCELNKAGAIVTASDIRPSNLSKALYRAFYQGLHNIDYRLIDLEEMHEVVKKDEYDVHFWSGSFYHLKNPIKVFQNICNLFKYTLIETHIAEEGKHNPIEQFGTYFGWRYSESGWDDPCSSKDSDKSFWLTRKSLLKLFDDNGMEIQKVIYEHEYNPHGERVCYLLKRP